MKKVKIISGTYGYNDRKHIIPKDRKSGAFALEDKEADRLVALGVAKYEGVPEYSNNKKSEDIPAENPEDIGESTGNKDEEEDDSEDYSDEDNADDTPKYGQENTNAELQAIANEWDIELPNRASKAQILEILDSHFGNAPKLSPMEPEQ